VAFDLGIFDQDFSSSSKHMYDTWMEQGDEVAQHAM
jgi:hypothetical protein